MDRREDERIGRQRAGKQRDRDAIKSTRLLRSGEGVFLGRRNVIPWIPLNQLNDRLQSHRKNALVEEANIIATWPAPGERLSAARKLIYEVMRLSATNQIAEDVRLEVFEILHFAVG